MHAGLFLLLLALCSGGASENSAFLKIQAFAGETAVLPCSISLQNDNPTVEWSKEGLKTDTAFLYRDGCETYEIKNQAFRFRTNLFLEEMKNGNISLRISNLELSDAGTYICTLVQRTPREVARLELVVVAVSEPKMSVVPAEGGGVTLQCETNCWFPKPEITFVDEHGNDISAEDPKINLDSGGCFTVTRRATVQTASNRTTCRVHQPNINQTRVTDIFHIPDNSWSSCTRPIVATVIPIIICASIAILCTILCRFYICERRQKSPVPDPSTQRNQADDNRNATAEHQSKIQELMSKLDEKENTIKQLTGEVNDLKSKRSPVVCQHDQPTFDNSPSKSSPDVSESINLRPKTINPPPKPTDLPPHQSDNSAKPAASTSSFNPKPGSPKRKFSKHGAPASRHSLPTDNGAVSPSCPPALPSEKGHVDRSMSFSKPLQNNVRLPRRHTVSAPYNNRFSVLGSLSEDTEPLIK